MIYIDDGHEQKTHYGFQRKKKNSKRGEINILVNDHWCEFISLGLHYISVKIYSRNGFLRFLLDFS